MKFIGFGDFGDWPIYYNIFDEGDDIAASSSRIMATPPTSQEAKSRLF